MKLCLLSAKPRFANTVSALDGYVWRDRACVCVCMCVCVCGCILKLDRNVLLFIIFPPRLIILIGLHPNFANLNQPPPPTSPFHPRQSVGNKPSHPLFLSTFESDWIFLDSDPKLLPTLLFIWRYISQSQSNYFIWLMSNITLCSYLKHTYVCVSYHNSCWKGNYYGTSFIL